MASWPPPDAGAGGSGLFPIQRRSRKARSLSAVLPNRAVPMIVSAITSSMTATISPSMGCSTPMPAGVPSAVTLAATDRQGTCSRTSFPGGRRIDRSPHYRFSASFVLQNISWSRSTAVQGLRELGGTNRYWFSACGITRRTVSHRSAVRACTFGRNAGHCPSTDSSASMVFQASERRNQR